MLYALKYVPASTRIRMYLNLPFWIPKDVELVKAAISVVKGMTENSHSESGISDGWDADRINKSISAICREYNIDSSDFVEESSISDGSNQW